MKTEKLEEVLKALKELGHENIEIFYDNGKKDKNSLIPIVATIKQSGSTNDRSVSLVFYRKDK